MNIIIKYMVWYLYRQKSHTGVKPIKWVQHFPYFPSSLRYLLLFLRYLFHYITQLTKPFTTLVKSPTSSKFYHHLFISFLQISSNFYNPFFCYHGLFHEAVLDWSKTRQLPQHNGSYFRPYNVPKQNLFFKSQPSDSQTRSPPSRYLRINPWFETSQHKPHQKIPCSLLRYIILSSILLILHSPAHFSNHCLSTIGFVAKAAFGLNIILFFI